MKSKIDANTNTSQTITATFESTDFQQYLDKALRNLGKNVKLDGFRKGKAPLKVVQKNVDQSILSQEFLNLAVPKLSADVLAENEVKAALPPAVEVTKFVPYQSLELKIKTEFIGQVKLPDYSNLSFERPKVTVKKKEIDNVVERIRFDMSQRKEVKRAAKEGDQVWIDFEGFDAKGKPVDGASGKDYPLNLGSKTFIPGFEDNIIGLKPASEKEFRLKFPKDYTIKALTGSEVDFKVKVNKVEQVQKPTLDIDLAIKIGNYESVDQLLEDIEQQIRIDKQKRGELELESQIMSDLVEKTDVEIPAGLIDNQIQRLLSDHQANLNYRGQSYESWLESEELSQKGHLDSLRPEAIKRIKGGVILSKIAESEGIEVTEADIEQSLAMYKQQYASDAEMSAQLSTPDARRDIAARLLTDRALAKLKQVVIK